MHKARQHSHFHLREEKIMTLMERKEQTTQPLVGFYLILSTFKQLEASLADIGHAKIKALLHGS